MSYEHSQLLLYHRQKLVDLDPSDPAIILFVKCRMKDLPLNDGMSSSYLDIRIPFMFLAHYIKL